MRILLHACCGPCTVECLRLLREEGAKATLFWCNPNIAPPAEYDRRRSALLLLAQQEQADVIEAKAPAPGPTDCRECYSTRLAAVAKYAAMGDFDCFTTTLLISPYQQHELIRTLGEQHTGFYYRDFRPHFRTGQRLSREMGLYMQKYCGCSSNE